MIQHLKNELLQVQIDTRGAELLSVKRGRCEYIWQGDTRFWDEHAPIMFPICGRVWQGKYIYQGKTYEMGLHGFARGAEFRVEEAEQEHVVLCLTDNEETQMQYPFHFQFKVAYRLNGDTLSVSFTVINQDSKTLYAAVGGHPGFCVPLEGEGDFSDWYLEFEDGCCPDVLLLSGFFATGKKEAFELSNENRLPLSHRLFDREGIFLHRSGKQVTLASHCSQRFIKLHHQMPYLGIWQPACTEAPFICLEPWSGFAGYEGEVEELTKKPDMLRILPGSSADMAWSVTFG